MIYRKKKKYSLYISVAKSVCIFSHFYAMGPESYRVRQNNYTAIAPFKVIQGRRFRYQSKGHTWLPISKQ